MKESGYLVGLVNASCGYKTSCKDILLYRAFALHCSPFVCGKSHGSSHCFFFLNNLTKVLSVLYTKNIQTITEGNQRFLKSFNKFAVRALPSLKHSAAPRVLNVIKHSCSFFKHYFNDFNI